ncbi:MAG: hypothetical protein OEW21_13280, partial [Betaproteobacteria bacterium]|nr:hypothetical protein [Betaproteobacteria bacterium]
QVIMVALVIAVPDIVGGGMAKKAAIDTDKIEIRVPDAATGLGAKTQGAMEDALERALGEDPAAVPGFDLPDAAKDDADDTDAAKSNAAAKPPGGKKN